MNSMSFELPPRRREPAFFVPATVIVLVLGLLAIQGAISFIGEQARDQIYFDWGFVPGRFTATMAPGWIASLIGRSSVDPQALTQARMLRDVGALNDGPHLYTLATYALLHGSWAHVGLNCVWLFAFGPPVARRFGWLRFTLFFLVTTIAGAVAHWAFAPFDAFPMIGASAADSGLMAAAARFIFRGGTMVSPGAFAGLGAVERVATLKELMTDRRALLFFGIWLATNFLFGAGAGVLGASDAPIAWVAHVGGFLAGLLLFGLFDRRPSVGKSSG
jgi:membrane associated rhomboid family serine protease